MGDVSFSDVGAKEFLEKPATLSIYDAMRNLVNHKNVSGIEALLSDPATASLCGSELCRRRGGNKDLISIVECQDFDNYSPEHRILGLLMKSFEQYRCILN